MKVTWETPIGTKVYVPWWIKLYIQFTAFAPSDVPFGTPLTISVKASHFDNCFYVADQSHIQWTEKPWQEWQKSLLPRYRTWFIHASRLRIWKER